MFKAEPSIIHLSTSADTTNYGYVSVYAGADATPTINGVTVTMGAGSSIEIMVNSISATPNVYVLGNKRNVFDGSTNLY